MQEFKINELITLKLEGQHTVIYVGGERFSQCKALFIFDPQTIDKQREIKSIDDVVVNTSFQEVLELGINPGEEIGITPEEEFWGHSSNIQAWYEYDYDTRLIHSNLAFPLLKKLTEIGDPLAKRVFKKEIAKRIGESPSLLKNLYMMGLFEFLTLEEIKNATLDLKFLNLQNCDLQEFPSFIFNLKNLNSLLLDKNKICEIPEDILNIKRLKYFSISDNKLEEMPISLAYLYNLEFLDLSNNSLSHTNFLKDKRSFPDLRELNLSLNNLTEFPSELCNIKYLEKLDLSNNVITIIPPSPLSESLRFLNLSSNNIEFLPQSISSLLHLETLVLSDNKIKYLYESLKNLHNLKSLYINGNEIESIPSYLGKLPSLSYLRVDKTQVSRIPAILKRKIQRKLIHLFIVQ